MKTYIWLLVFFMFVISGCSTIKPSINKKDRAQRVRELAEAYLAEEKYVQAYRELMKARELDPDDPHVHYDLGFFYFEKKKYDRAIEEYQKAIDLKHDFATARNNLGVVYMALEDWDKAIEVLTPLTEDYLYATPHFPHFLIGQACFHKQNYTKALAHFLECRDLQPEFPFAAHWLGKTYMETGNPAQAISALEDALALTPAAVFLLDLSRAYAQAGNYDKAKESLQQAACLATENALKQDILVQQKLLNEESRGK